MKTRFPRSRQEARRLLTEAAPEILATGDIDANLAADDTGDDAGGEMPGEVFGLLADAVRAAAEARNFSLAQKIMGLLKSNAGESSAVNESRRWNARAKRLLRN